MPAIGTGIGSSAGQSRGRRRVRHYAAANPGSAVASRASAGPAPIYTPSTGAAVNSGGTAAASTATARRKVSTSGLGQGRGRGATLSRVLQGVNYKGLDSEQKQVVNTILAVGLKRGESVKSMLSAVETGLVESGLRNLSYGDADSEGWRQERTSIYGSSHPTNVVKSAEAFYDEIKTDAGGGRGMSAPAIAQAVQGSAFPERYAQPEVVSQAQGIVGKFLKATKNVKGVGKIPGVSRPLRTSELFYDPGISLKNGQQIGPIGNHSDHVHYASTNPRSILRAARIAERHGATVTENPAFDQVDPVHVGGSYHYRNMKLPGRLQELAQKVGASGKVLGEAIDISGGNLGAIDRRLAALSGAPGAGAASIGGTLGGYGGGAAAPPSLGAAPTSGLRPTGRTGRAGSAPISSPTAARSVLPDAFQKLAAGSIVAAADGGEVADEDLLSVLAGTVSGKSKPRKRIALGR